MNKTIWKIFIRFVLLATVISLILMCINFIAFAFVGSDVGNVYPNTQRYILEQISENLIVSENEIKLADTKVVPNDSWCIIIDGGGDIIWSHNKPDDIPDNYSINDIARMTRWFLNDYPVYVRCEDYGLIVLGIPKNSVGKYAVEYSKIWFDTLPERIVEVLIVNFVFAALLAGVFGITLYRKLKLLTTAISDLRQEKRVHLKEKGMFKDIIKNINDTSDSIERKNTILKKRDNARSNWIAGISHDIRTPLSIVMGYSEALLKSARLSEKNRRQAEIITAQSIKIKKLIDDLNLISSLEYDMQPSDKKEVRLCPLLRDVVSDIKNRGLEEKYEINIDIKYEQAIIMGDENLIERALFNLINNSITHNEKGCVIDISEYAEKNNVYIKICDNGKGVSDEVLKNIDVIPKTTHGIGLPMAYKIFCVHGGKMDIKNDKGFCVLIELPMCSKK